MPSNKYRNNDGLRKLLMDANANITRQKYNEGQGIYIFSKHLPKLPTKQRENQEFYSGEAWQTPPSHQG